MRSFLAISAGLWLAAVECSGQIPIRNYRVDGPPRTPERIQQMERQRAILTDGWNLSPTEAPRLEKQLAQTPHDIPIRVRLVSYYSQYMINEPRVRHVLWLIENHPEADIFEDAATLTWVSPTSLNRDTAADAARAKALWQQHAARIPAKTKVLFHAAMALSSTDPDAALQCIEAMRRAEPRSTQWTRLLAKTYADAIRWTFWDGKSTMTFTGDAEDFRYPRFSVPPAMESSLKARLDSSTDSALVRTVGEVLLREIQLLGDSRATPELPQVESYAKTLLARARTLDSK